MKLKHTRTKQTKQDAANKEPEVDLQKVMIVDDEEDVCFLIKSILQSHGFQVSVCHTIKCCEREINEIEPQFMILDINLPDGNGLDLLAKLHDSESNVKVIMHSAQDTTENRKKAEQGGAAGFLTKPINRAALLSHFQL